MKVLTRLIGVALCCAALPALAAGDTGASTCLKRAEAVLAALDAGDFEKARVDFDERMQSGLGADKLRQVWAALPQQVSDIFAAVIHKPFDVDTIVRVVRQLLPKHPSERTL